MTSTLLDQLVARAAAADVQMTEALARKLESYYRLLATWNEKINLSGLPLASMSNEALDRMLIEPLVAAKYAASPTNRMVDIGSGGGSPAIPLALALTGVRLLMVESKTRKSAFLNEAIRAVELTNASVMAARADQLLRESSFRNAYELITVRAVRFDAVEWAVADHLLHPAGRLFLFRGVSQPAYHGSLTQPWRVSGTFPLASSNNSWLDVLEKSR